MGDEYILARMGVRVRRVSGWILLLLLLGAAPFRLARADKSSPVPVAEIKRAFLAASDPQSRAAALAPLLEYETGKALRVVRNWLRQVEEDRGQVFALAHLVVELDDKRGLAAILQTCRRKGCAAMRPGLLRIAVDAGALSSKDRRSLRKVKFSPVEHTLLRMAARTTATKLAPGMDVYELVEVLTHRLPEARTWDELVPTLRALHLVDAPLTARFTSRLLAHLPVPSAAEVASLPASIARDLARRQLPSALARALPTLSVSEADTLLQSICASRSPHALPGLIEAFGKIDPDSILHWQVYAALLNLSGVDVPREADFWRSWWAGNQATLLEYAALPYRRTSAEMVAKGVSYLLRVQEADGAFRYEPDGENMAHNDVGATALALFALRAAQVPPTHPCFRRGVVYLKTASRRFGGAFEHTYAAGLKLMALQSIDAKRHKNELVRISNVLMAGQSGPLGGWTYTANMGTEADAVGVIDLSNTQYAALGLRRARMGGIPIAKKTWRELLRLIRETEYEESGDWHYGAPMRAGQSSVRPGMAAIAAACIVLARSESEPGLAREAVLDDPQLERALRSMARKYGRARTYKRLDLYTMYSVERVGALLGIAAFDGVPWHHASVEALRRRQNGDGSWGRLKVEWYDTWGKVVDTAYALLILRKATTPVFSGGLDVPADPAVPIVPFKGTLPTEPGPAWLDRKEGVDEPTGPSRAAGGVVDAAVYPLREQEREALWEFLGKQVEPG